MKYLLILTALIMLAGCEATAVKNSAAIKTKAKINADVSLPLNTRIAYYVDKSDPDKKVNFYGKMEEAAELVSKDFFSDSGVLSSDKPFDYLVKIKTSSNWDYVWGGWENDISVDILDPNGTAIFSKTLAKKASSAGGVYDFNAVFNAFATALKEVMIEFSNRHHSNLVANENTNVDIKKLFAGIEPSTSGTGFFINNKGQSVTAAHVLDSCIFVEVQHKGEVYPATMTATSNLLDLAVVSIDFANDTAVSIEPTTTSTLGKQVFVTGYPLAGILSDYPSLTIGNISSKGGLKGAKGYFQFSAPIQPGNSGGAITDYKGNLMGVVSSSLNQRMMLEKTNTTSQNVNFGVDAELLTRFLDKNSIEYKKEASTTNFETSSGTAVEYSNQILCYL